VAFAGTRIRIEHRGDAAREIVEFLSRDTFDSPEVAPQARFAAEVDTATNLITIRRDDEVRYRGSDLAGAARTLQEITSRALASGSGGGLLLHAASVGRDGRVVLLCGASGAGKTTLAAHLVARGWRLLSDELSFLPDGSSRVQGLRRPFGVKASGRSVLPAVSGTAGWRSLRGPLVDLLQPPASRSSDDREAPILSAIVFPEYRSGAAGSPTRLAAARCGLRLMACLLNARHLAEHGFPAVVELARRTPAHALVHGDAAWASAWIEDATARRGG
jgi:hypothetical protein